MKWKILISILLLLPVLDAKAQDPEIGVEVLENLFFGRWMTSSNCDWVAVYINKGASNLPQRIIGGGGGAFPSDNIWYAAKVRVYYISNGSSKKINITSFQHSNATLFNEVGSGQVDFQTYGFYWGEVSGNQQYVLSPSNPEAIFYLGGVAAFDKNTPAGIYTHPSIQVSIGYWLQ